MKLISPHEYTDLRSEMNEFVVLCKKQNYRPVQEDFNDIIQFLLINHTGVGHMCESFEENPDYIVNHIFESFKEDIESIDEYTAFKGDSSYDNSKDFETATGLVKTGAAVAAGAALGGAVATGMYVQYLFKKGKVKKLIQKELDAKSISKTSSNEATIRRAERSKSRICRFPRYGNWTYIRTCTG